MANVALFLGYNFCRLCFRANVFFRKRDSRNRDLEGVVAVAALDRRRESGALVGVGQLRTVVFVLFKSSFFNHSLRERFFEMLKKQFDTCKYLFNFPILN
jgi:hypothetical protein